MATFKIVDSYPPFDYGSAVRWSSNRDVELTGSICGFEVVDTVEKAALSGREMGTVIVLVEDPTGETNEVDLRDLKLL